jgi:hypothetical protein
MWRDQSDGTGAAVVCIACGDSLPRREAREYDKEGDRWERGDKEFEYLCKDCHGDLSHQPRAELEATLEAAEGADLDAAAFLERYLDEAKRRADGE